MSRVRQFGLIGFPLSHSFSKKYFAEKFEKEGISDANYNNFELESIEDFPALIKRLGDKLVGLNVTIPHKQAVIPYLTALDPAAEKIGAVNVIKFEKSGALVGYNSDYYGFLNSLKSFVGQPLAEKKALVLGTGGASKAVIQALEDEQVAVQVVSRSAKPGILSYEQVDAATIEAHELIINSTPLGMHPKVDACPDIPYDALTANHFLYDLVYNPEETLFMKKGREQGAKAIHGLEMLTGQAEKAWEIWNS